MPRLLDFGIHVDVITDVDVSTIDGIRFDVLKPDYTRTTWDSGSVVISGEGRVRYKFQIGDLDQIGEYVIAPWLDFSATKKFHTPAVTLQVYSVYQP